MISQAPGTAVMISHNAPRYTQSLQCFEALERPAGTRMEHFAAGLDLAQAREQVAAACTGEWLFFIDDDHVHGPDLLQRLLGRLDEHPELDLVASFVLRRWPPHYSVAARLNPDSTATILNFESGSGVVPVDLTGLGGGSVIRRSALARVRRPWFTGGRFTEDWTFCTRLKASGGQAAVDLACPVGHITPMSVWPSREAGQWGVSYAPIRDGSQATTLAIAAAAVTEAPVEVVA